MRRNLARATDAARNQNNSFYVAAGRRFNRRFNDEAGSPDVFISHGQCSDEQKLLDEIFERAETAEIRAREAEDSLDKLSAQLVEARTSLRELSAEARGSRVHAAQADAQIRELVGKINVMSAQLNHVQEERDKARAEADALRARQHQQQQHQQDNAPADQAAAAPIAAVHKYASVLFCLYRQLSPLVLWRVVWQLLQVSYVVCRVFTVYTAGISVNDMVVDVVSTLLFSLPLRWSLGVLAAVLFCTSTLAPPALRSRAAAPFQARVDYYGNLTSSTVDWMWTEDAEHYFGNRSATFVLQASRSLLFDVDEYLSDARKPTCFHKHRLPPRFNTHPTCSRRRTICYGLFQRVGVCVPIAHLRACTFCYPEPRKYVYPDNPWRYAFDEWMLRMEMQKHNQHANRTSSHENSRNGTGFEKDEQGEDASSSSYYYLALGAITANSMLISAALTFDVVRQRIMQFSPF